MSQSRIMEIRRFISLLKSWGEFSKAALDTAHRLEITYAKYLYA